VCGHDVGDDMDALREVMGVCPQHDVLWPDLTAREHLAMFADIRGISAAQIPDYVDEKLHEILLQNVADVPSGKFSGGMKRRLSIGISSIGNPRVIFMDEPTTGTDPGNRRMIWSLCALPALLYTVPVCTAVPGLGTAHAHHCI
jgi:ABC-type multidrug transport system ATPase subunit